jgi:homoserine dehydrogenase
MNYENSLNSQLGHENVNRQNIALIGFGTVGQGLVEILRDKRQMLKEKHDYEFNIVAVSDFLKGSIYYPDGLDIDKLLDLACSGKDLSNYAEDSPGCESGWDALTTIRESNANVICELTYTDIKTGGPALEHVRTALAAGKHVTTSNKGPAALAYRELTDLASENGVLFLFEGTVMSGTPVLNFAKNNLASCEISAIQGILNGTTNFILTKMEEGESYDAVLKEAQELGYAEADPTADVEGHDALAKVTILANVVMGENVKPSDIPCQGISHLTQDDIQKAQTEGKRWKLISSVKKSGDGIEASVAPQMVDFSHPLAEVSGSINAITFTTDLLGDVTVVGPGAGKEATGFALLSDLLEIGRKV